MIELTTEQQLAIDGSSGEPPRVLDPRTRMAYVLVPADAYEKMKRLFDDTDPEALYPLLADLEPDDWEDASVYGIGSGRP